MAVTLDTLLSRPSVDSTVQSITQAYTMGSGSNRAMFVQLVYGATGITVAAVSLLRL